MTEWLTDMTEPLRLRITIVVNLAFLLLCTVVPGKLEQPLPFSHRILRALLRSGVGCRVTKEVKIEGSILILDRADKGHAHNLLVELETSLGGLDPEHGMIQSVGAWICRSPHVLVVAADDLNPVSIGILCKRNVLHAALGELLLELIPSVFESLAGRFDIVDRDGDVSETAMGLRVPIGNSVIGVILRAIVVREFQHGIAVRPVTVALQRLGAIVGEEVEGELVLRKVELLDLIEPKELVEFH